MMAQNFGGNGGRTTRPEIKVFESQDGSVSLMEDGNPTGWISAEKDDLVGNWQ